MPQGNTVEVASLGWYIVAAVGEIGGCFAFWAWLRMHKSTAYIIPGVAALILFAMALTRIQTSNAGRAYAAYGGVYILASILWLWCVEGVAPDRWDLIGAFISLTGASVILLGRH
jgi:small multidrug resistance family-3 protein